ncbi:MAG TPA: hypothetical protein PL078_05060 [Bacillota bacterium]|jgi:hypothetical protein|nr:hypothetical protein [Peptococcaceae bacterium MAG4]HPU36322.1 hypothetical protein [Bacillota bacterium]HPZ43358.1 hypothetical protein [Bacillota bacterium]HQD76520.1 hypothetical protein [Bacillota bacterium]HUM58728.1 hypothetical protein [Bacillota bacterium]
MAIALLALIFIAIIALEVPGLVRKKMWRELTAFSVLLLIGMVLSFGQALKLPLPNPTRGIEALFGPVAAYLEKLLG